MLASDRKTARPQGESPKATPRLGARCSFPFCYEKGQLEPTKQSVCLHVSEEGSGTARRVPCAACP